MADNVEIQGLEFKVVGDVEDACKGVNKLTASLNKLKSATKGGLGLSSVITNELSGMRKVDGATQTLKNAKATATGAISSMKDVEKATEKATQSTNIFSKIAGTMLKGSLKATGWSLKQLFVKPFATVGRVIGWAGEKLGHFLSSLKRIALYRAVRFILSTIVSSIKEGSENLYNYSKTMGTTFHQSLNTIATDALFLKNSLAAAVAPIINALAPAIDFLADKVAHLLNLLAQLFARLSGKSTYTKAVKAATEYGNAVGGAAEKAKSFTAGFDELNVFDPNSGGGGGGGLGDVSKMFEEATIDDEISSFADQLKAAFKGGDWKGLGKLLSDKVNEVIAGIDFAAAGTGLVNGVSAALEVVFGFVGGLNGREIVDGLCTFLKSVFNETSNRLGQIEWRQLGNKLYTSLKDTFTGVDFSGLAKSFFRLIGSALGSAVAFLGSFCGSVWADIKAYFSGKIEECGGDIPAGLWKGIKDAFKNVGTWIKENMVDPFVEGFKKCFGIHSPSTVMAEIGGYVVEGFFKGVGTFRNFRSTISEWAGAVVEWFRKGEDGKGIVEHFKEFGSNVVTGFKDKVGTTYQTVKTNVTTWASNVRDWFTNSSYGGVNSTNFATYANNIITGFKDKVGSTYSTVKSSITTWASGVKDWFSGSSYGGVNSTTFGTYASNVLNGFKNYISNNYTNVKSSMTTFASKVKSWFTDTVSYNSFYQVAADVVSGFKNGIGNLYQTCKNTISSWGSSIIAWFKDKLDSNSPSKVFERIGEDTIRGYNLGINALGGTTKGVVTSWANSFTGVKPTMSFAVDTSALKYYDSKSFAQSIVPNVNSNHNFTVAGIAEAMQEFYHEYVEPTMMQMAEDMRRQADKKEQTVVQIGNRTITDAVTTQRNANGYQFTTA